MLFEITNYDKKIYAELEDFLPDRMIDIHCHVWKSEHMISETAKRSAVWPTLIAKDNSIEDLEETYRLLFPSKIVTPLIFANPSTSIISLKKMNDYVSSSDYPALYFSHPLQTAEELEKEIKKGDFLGVKSYLDLADASIPSDKIRIFDFFPKHQLAILDRLKAIMMLHIPRPKRILDRENLSDIREISQKYPNIKIIIAHIGRAYIPSDVGNSIKELSDCKNLLFDFSASTCAFAMAEVLEQFGSEHLLFGSDLPILRMRTKRIEENGTYINLVPPNLYGDTKQDAHLREISKTDAEKITFFMYEELLAFKQAANQVGLSKIEIENVFFNNANKLINRSI